MRKQILVVNIETTLEPPKLLGTYISSFLCQEKVGACAEPLYDIWHNKRAKTLILKNNVDRKYITHNTNKVGKFKIVMFKEREWFQEIWKNRCHKMTHDLVCTYFCRLVIHISAYLDLVT